MTAPTLPEPRPDDEGRYVPGKWVCPTCGFVQAMLTLNAHSGAMSASVERALPCPNDGQYMERQTWEAHARDLEAMLIAALDRERSAPLGATDEGLGEALAPTAWPLHDVLRVLADAAEHLMRDHSCDQHGYEQIDQAIAAARAALQAGAAS